MDAKATYLTAAATNSATSLAVASTSGVPTSGVLQIDSELLSYSTADATHFTVTRGFSGTTAAAHAANATVKFPLSAAHVNGLRGALFALEANVGTGNSTAASASTGQCRVKQSDGSVQWAACGAGEANTASNVNAAGVGVFKQKSGADLQFRGVNAGSSKVTVTNDSANNEIDVDVAQANLDRNAIGGSALTLANGGTGAADAGTARTNLGAAPLASPAFTGTPSGPSFSLTGAAGSGFLEAPAQSSNPAAPSGGFRAFADASGRFSWRRASDGFVRTFDATLTANRVYTLPDAAGALLLDSAAQTVTNKTISGASNTLSNIGNTSLTNSSVTIGSTPVSLGATAATLAGLTLTTPNIASFANATHNHTNAAGGGQLTTAALSDVTATTSCTLAVTFGGGSTGLTTSMNVCRYWQTGKTVTVIARIELSAKGSSTGAAVITGLPAASLNVTNLLQFFPVEIENPTTAYAGATWGYITPNSTALNLILNNGGAAAAMTHANFDNTSGVRIAFTYIAN